MVEGIETTTGSVVWDNDQPTPAARAETARYQCGSCAGQWTTAQKNAAVAHGRSVPRVPASHPPRKVGFHLNRILSLFPGGRLESLVADFLAAKNDPLKLQIFVNNSLGEHWTSYVGKDVGTEDVLRCRVDLPPRTVPAEAVCLVVGIDTQRSGFWFRVRAFARDTTSWGIDHGYLPTWEDLEALLYSRRYPIVGSDKTAGIWRGLIDTGGTKHDGDSMSRTEEVYHWIRRNYGRPGARVFPSKGSSSPMQGLVKLGAPLEKTPSGKTLAGAPIQIVSVDTDKAKDGLWWRMGLVGTSEPGAAYLHSETGDDYAKQITAERKRTNRKGEIEWVRIRPDNHYLDCEGLCFAAVDPGLLGGILALPRPKKAEPEEKKPKPRQDDGDDFWTRGTSGGGMFG
jgi:phage terminase large subunit GpA-like protein